MIASMDPLDFRNNGVDDIIVSAFSLARVDASRNAAWLGPNRPYVQFTYQVGDVEVLKRVGMVHGHDLVTLEYAVSMDRARTIEFDLMPFLAMRDFHSLRRRGEIGRAHV